MIHLIFSFILFATPCFAVFDCSEDVAKVKVCHEDKSDHQADNDDHESDKQNQDSCSVHCHHPLALFIFPVPLYLNDILVTKFPMTSLLYLSPVVESLKRPPIKV
jgi:hypothetical protein